MSFLKPEYFFTDNFYVEEFIREARQALTLEQFLKELNNIHHILNNKLVDLINKDYSQFLSLSSNLIGIDNKIQHLLESLNIIKITLLELKENISNSKKELEVKIQHKKEVKDQIKIVKLIISINQLVEKIENLFTQFKSTKYPQMIEMIASHFCKLQILISSLQQKSASRINKQNGANQLDTSWEVEYAQNFLNGIKDRFVSIRNSLLLILENYSRIILEEKNQETTLNLLRSFMILRKPSKAEQNIKAIIQAPLSEIINQKNLSSKGLEFIYDQILNYIKKEFSFLFNLCNKHHLSDFSFLENSIWSAIEELIESEIPTISSTRYFELFNQNYRVSIKFLDQIKQNFIFDQQGIQKFVTHNSTKKFLKKWNLLAYFQICLLKISEEFNTLCNSTSLQDQEAIFLQSDMKISPDHSSFLLQISKKFWLQLSSCWNDKFYLDILIHKFLKLSFQLFSKLQVWISRQIAPTNQQKPSSQQLIFLIYDIQVLMKNIPELYNQNVLKSLRTNDKNQNIQQNNQITQENTNQQNTQIIQNIQQNEENSISVLFTQSLSDILDSLQQISQNINQIIIQNFTQICSKELEFVRKIKSKYHMTDKPTPTECSPSVSQIYTPFTSFLNSDLISNLIDQNSKFIWSKGLIQKLSTKYFNEVKDFITSVQETDNALKRFRFNLMNTSPNSQENSQKNEEESYIQKIYHQVILDITEFKKISLSLLSQNESISQDEEIIKIFSQMSEYINSLKILL
ncbi:conserved oligomeric golgi complex component 2 [Anaeramoeba ignava]|uniref:Conserved oligomeric Golgi complex subunit 2 n=1 Tax=Anaeramoeba ignava TaxID=1746090 RepID=A0A9Q0LLV1_ANAIG|nr:conserved oligomeric golgi complex component 2 [Anaeramoeba ignava]